MLIFWLILALQESQDAPAPQEAIGQTVVEIPTVSPGNVVDFNGFRVYVPPQFLMAMDEGAEFMYRKFNIANIPNCRAVFIPDSEDNSYFASLQHYPYQPFNLEPRKPADFFIEYFKFSHMYYQSPFLGTCEVILPPTYDETEQSFSIGLHYTSPVEPSTVYIKKVWARDQEAMVLTVRVNNFDNYRQNEELIAQLLSTVQYEAQDEAPLNIEPTSYLALLGVDPDFTSIDEASEGLPLGVKLTSAALVIFAITLLIFARKSHLRNHATTQSKDNAPEEQAGIPV